MHTPSSRPLGALALVLTIAACSSDDGGGQGQNDTAADTGEVSFPDTSAPDTDTSPLPDTAVEVSDDSTGSDTADTSEVDGPCDTFGCPCGSNADCLDGLCVEGVDGQVCSVPCSTVCDLPGFACLPVQLGGADPFTACVPIHPHLCKPCRADSDCENDLIPSATSVCISRGPDGSFCGSSCATVPCPAGYACEDVVLSGGGTTRQCVPEDDTCECRPSWSSMNLWTDCAREGAAGTCPGERTCGVDGLTACSADTPGAEVCNGNDDDCDGATDDIASAAPRRATSGPPPTRSSTSRRPTPRAATPPVSAAARASTTPATATPTSS